MDLKEQLKSLSAQDRKELLKQLQQEEKEIGQHDPIRKTAGDQVNTTHWPAAKSKFSSSGQAPGPGLAARSLGQPGLHKVLAHEFHPQQGAQDGAHQDTQDDDAKHRPGEQASMVVI